MNIDCSNGLHYLVVNSKRKVQGGQHWIYHCIHCPHYETRDFKIKSLSIISRC